MYNKLLVTLDGSRLAEAALPFARFLATALHLPVVLLHVNDPETALRTEGNDYLGNVAASFPTPTVVNCRREQGKAAEVILDTAAADRDSLIVMASHGQSGGQRWRLGQVAQKVLQASANPLLIIRPDAKALSTGAVRWTSIIVPLDGSQLAEKILPHVVYLASRLKLAVLLIRTYTLPTSGYFMAAGLSPSDLENIRASIKGEATDYLQARVTELKAQGAKEVSFALMEGKGPEEIIDLAKRTPDNLVAMSSHGRSGIGRWVMGSVTDRVVSYSGDPVLVVRSTASST
jgi:nucleotide-binding universal stress UspA family protein